MLELRPLPALSDNYIWLLADAASRSALVVDPGEAAPVLKALAAAALRLTAILVTHHHADHIGGIDALLAQYPDAQVIGPDDARIAGITHRVADGDRVQLDRPGSHFEVIAVPGHTRSHLAYYGEGILFCGDTLFSLGCGRLFEGTPAQMLASLDRLAALPGNTRVCCAHEYTLANAAFAVTVDPDNAALRDCTADARNRRARGVPSLPSRIDTECAANPFLRVAALPATHFPHPVGTTASTNRVERFAALRLAKDHFRP